MPQRALLLLVLLPATACRPAVVAPDTVEEMMVFGFANFEADDHVQAMLPGLDAWVDDHLDQLGDGYAVRDLRAEHLQAAGVDADEVDGILGALGVAAYEVSVDEVAAAITEPNRAAVYPDTVAYEVLRDTDRDCFLAHACASYELEAEETTKVPILGASTRHITSQLRWIPALDDGEETLALRQLVPEPVQFDTELIAIDRQFGVTFLRTDGAGTRRTEAIWIDARVLGLDLPEGYAVRTAVQRMQRSADDVDAFYGDDPSPD